MEPLGVRAKIDAAGNLRGIYPAAQLNAPRLLIGSHIDTVPNAGAYDGILGVVLALALLEELKGKKLPFGIEVIAFSEEEGVRFGTPFIGSRALVGRLDQKLLETQDAQGVSVRTAIKNFGLNPEEIPEAELDKNVLGYLEFHIEQGPVLEKLDLPLAVVETIAGQSRLEFIFRRPLQPCRYNSHGTSLRCACGCCGVDQQRRTRRARSPRSSRDSWKNRCQAGSSECGRIGNSADTRRSPQFRRY